MTAPLIKLRDEIEKNKLDAILISSIPNIIYLTNYSGFSKEEREAYILLVAQPQGLTRKTPGVLGYILTDARYTKDVKALIPDFKLIEISSKNSLKDIFKKLTVKHKIKRLGFEGNNISFLEHQKLKKYFNSIYHLSISKLRAVKTSEEISAIEKACQLGDKTFNYILKEIRLGISEKELAVKIELFVKQNLADLSFHSIVAFGKNSAVPHHVPNDDKLTNNQIIKLDFGVKLNNYCSDMTRTVFFGKASTEFKKMYDAVAEAQTRAIDYLSHCHSELVSESTKGRSRNKFGMTGKDVDKVARDYIVSQGFPSIPHSLGHGIGLQIHEAPSLSPNSKDILKENMVFSVEPGIYLPDFGGVRIEDLVVLEKTGPRLLTHSPKTIIEL